MSAALVSLVIPVYYNEDNLPATWEALEATFSSAEAREAGCGTDWTWEVVFVDDGSGDRSFERLCELQARVPERVRVVKLSRNFGQTSAILAGFRTARGACCVVMSADLQDPPDLIPEMVRRWRNGSRIVLATRSSRGDGALSRWGSRLFYRLMRRYALPNMPPGGFDFFLVDRKVVGLVNRIEEKNTFLQGQILWTGFTPDVIPYRRRAREIGTSRWTLSKKLKYFIDGFATYTVAPIRLISVVGLIVSLLSFSYAGLIVAAYFLRGTPIEGWSPIMVSILGLSGVQMLMLGIIGEYLWRSYHETRRLPNFVVDTTVERDAPTPDEPLSDPDP